MTGSSILKLSISHQCSRLMVMFPGKGPGGPLNVALFDIIQTPIELAHCTLANGEYTNKRPSMSIKSARTQTSVLHFHNSPQNNLE